MTQVVTELAAFCNKEDHQNLSIDLQTHIHPDNCGIFQDMAKAFSEAEKYLKLVELDSTLDIPSVNELRYVGFHLLKSLKAGISAQEQKEEIRRAKRHCERACYDSVELGLLCLLQQVSEFQGRYIKFNVTTNLSEYQTLLDKCEEAKVFIGATSNEDKPSYYRNLFDHYEAIRKIKIKLDRVEPSVRSSALVSKISVGNALTATFLAILTLTLGVLQYQSSNKIDQLQLKLDTINEQSNQLAKENEALKKIVQENPSKSAEASVTSVK